MQAASAFAIVQGAFGWLVDNYPRLADWNASARRIASLMMSLDGLERAEQGDGMGRIQRGETEGDAMLSLDNLSVTLDDGTAVVKETEVVIEPGERVLVAGESGSGKSTLVRRSRGCGRGAAAASISTRPATVHVAATALRALGHASPRGRLSRRRRDWTRGADRRSPRQGGPRSSRRTRSRRTRRGTRPCRVAKSSGSPSRGCSCTIPTSSCWTKRPRRSMRRARTR